MNRAWNSINDLAGDRFSGRKAGTEGATLASDYIATYFSSIGLKPAGSDGSYRTKFRMPLWNLTSLPTLALLDSTGNELQSFEYRRDFNIQQGSGSGQYCTGIVFVGYGISAPSLGHDDYANVSVAGKNVLAIVGAPRDSRLEDYVAWYSKAQTAVSHGAVGMILVDSPANPTPHYIERWSGGWLIYDKFVILRGTIAIANALLKDSETTLPAIQQTIDKQVKPESIPLGKQLRVSVTVTFTQTATAYNVLGFLPGSDPGASKMTVIIGAHYDHLGKDVDDTIFRGANDDASGVAVLMEIARILALGAKPRWSVLFAAWCGEEEGYWGASAYVGNPYFPLAGTIAYLNLDMVGAGPAGLAAELSETHESLKRVVSQSAGELGIALNFVGYSGGSDHVPFEESEVHSLMFIYLPLDGVYHTPADTVDHISRSKLLETGKLTALIALKTAQANLIEPGLTATSATATETRITQPTTETPDLRVYVITVAVLIVLVGTWLIIWRRRRKDSDSEPEGSCERLNLAEIIKKFDSFLC